MGRLEDAEPPGPQVLGLVRRRIQEMEARVCQRTQRPADSGLAAAESEASARSPYDRHWCVFEAMDADNALHDNNASAMFAWCADLDSDDHEEQEACLDWHDALGLVVEDVW